MPLIVSPLMAAVVLEFVACYFLGFQKKLALQIKSYLCVAHEKQAALSWKF
jgi:hypothetical protein